MKIMSHRLLCYAELSNMTDSTGIKVPVARVDSFQELTIIDKGKEVRDIVVGTRILVKKSQPELVIVEGDQRYFVWPHDIIAILD